LPAAAAATDFNALTYS